MADLDSDIEIPCFFICPISLNIMKDPVTLSTGITYDHDSIEKWLFSQKNDVCPITLMPIGVVFHSLHGIKSPSTPPFLSLLITDSSIVSGDLTMAGSSNDSTLPMHTLIHLITIRLSSSNYLLWVNQMVPLLNYQHLLAHVDGSSEAPPTHHTVDAKQVENPAFEEWQAADQRTVLLLQASLTEEAFSEIVGLSSARAIWTALESAYGNFSMERV
uniref:U-box domain-containing protein n=1 Tax=Lactuca sativa TaxID=4236 RepID=A0A9R1WT02_LACSA|nr:hypothetical protein LSAT_V11C100023320 [Lactuca sativa]